MRREAVSSARRKREPPTPAAPIHGATRSARAALKAPCFCRRLSDADKDEKKHKKQAAHSRTNNSNNAREDLPMKNPLDSLWGTIISGLVLLVILYVFAVNFLR